MSNNVTFKKWYDEFQELLKIWKELSSNQNWIEAHKDELEQQGLNPDELGTSIRKDIDMLITQMLSFDEENKQCQ